MPKEYVKLSRELLDAAWEYIDSFESEGDEIPSIAGFCRLTKASRKNTYLWLENTEGNELREEWALVHEMLMTEQERTLLNGGLSKKFDSALTKMILTKHGYSDKQAIEHSGSLDSLTDEQINERIAKLISTE